MSKVIYDAKHDRIYEGFEYNGNGQYILEYEDKEVKITAKTKRGLRLPTETLIIIGDM